MATTRINPQRSWLAVSAGLVIAAVALALAGGAEALLHPGPSGGVGGPDNPNNPNDPIHTETLTTEGHNEFTDDVAVQVRDQPDGQAMEVVNLRDASNIAVFEFTIQPGVWFAWHTHPGPVLAAVAEGDLVFIYGDDCVERPYGEGEAFVDPGVVHTAYNPSGSDETVVIATVLGVDAGAPPATPVDPEEAAALNEACGTHAPVPDPDAGSHND